MSENSYVLTTPGYNAVSATIDSYFSLLGSNTILALIDHSDGNAAFIYGHRNAVAISNSEADRVADNGQGSTIIVGQGYTPITDPKNAGPFNGSQLWNFQHDLYGTIDVNSPWDKITPDGRGGTLISFLNGSLDVIGDPNAGAHVHLSTL